jgi:hypothetical protein
MAAELSREYIRTTFIPTVKHTHELPGCENKLAILFFDNCLCCCSDDILKEMAEHGILVIRYLPHTSEIFQVLDDLISGK